MRVMLSLMALLGAGACSEVPELDAAVPAWVSEAPYPALVPLDRTFDTITPPRQEAAEIEAELAARAARLQARADALRTPVVDAPSRTRMQDGTEAGS